MAVARLHGKVKCRPFKGKGRRAPLTNAGIAGDHPFVPAFASAENLRGFGLCYLLAVLRSSVRRLQLAVVLLPSTWEQAAMFGSLQRTRPV